MLRAGPFSDERVVALANRRFVPFYFDLSDAGAAGDAEARKFVVAKRAELGGRGVPTPPVLFMTPEGEVLGEVSNYATEDQVCAAMCEVLRAHPEWNAPTEAEGAEGPPPARARIALDLLDLPAARALLAGVAGAETELLRARVARLEGKWD